MRLERKGGGRAVKSGNSGTKQQRAESCEETRGVLIRGGHQCCGKVTAGEKFRKKKGKETGLLVKT